MSINNEKQSGFTLIELLTVMSMLIVMASMILPVFGNLQASTVLKDSESQLIQAIRVAQSYSCHGRDNSDHGIYFETGNSANDKIIIYSGENYIQRKPELDEKIVFDPTTKITHSFPDNEIIFYKNSCLPDKTGGIKLKSDTINKAIDLTMNSLGIISK